jgi:hypothetical protein
MDIFSSLAALAITNYLKAHAATATLMATIAGYHLVFWIAAAEFLGGAVLAAILFRSGPLPVDADAEPVAVHWVPSTCDDGQMHLTSSVRLARPSSGCTGKTLPPWRYANQRHRL